jgi:hypothetical protein
MFRILMKGQEKNDFMSASNETVLFFLLQRF